MSKPGRASDMEPRLTRIDFPRMNVDHAGSPFHDRYPAHPPEDVAHRQKAKVAASHESKIASREADSGNGEFSKGPSRAFLLPWMSVGIGNPIAVVHDGEDRRVVNEALLGQNIEGPQRILDHRVRGCPVPKNRFSDQILDESFGVPNVLSEVKRRHHGDGAMVIPVNPNLVPSFMHLYHERRVALGHPAEHEEGRLDIEFSQHREKTPRVGYDPLFHRTPISGIDDLAECLDVEIVLHVDAEHAYYIGTQWFPTIQYVLCDGHVNERVMGRRIPVHRESAVFRSSWE